MRLSRTRTRSGTLRRARPLVDVDDAGFGLDRRANVIDVEVMRCSFEQNEERVAEQSNRADDENRCDEETCDRVGRDRATEANDERSHERSDASERVAE